MNIGVMSDIVKMNKVIINAAARDNRLVLEQALSSVYGELTDDDIHGALLKACIHGNINCVSRLLDEICLDINHEDEDGNTALMLATSNLQTRVVELLISCGCDIDRQSDRGRTALHMAVWNCSPNIVSCLLNAGAHTDLQDCYGDSAVMLCARKGCSDIMELLLISGAGVHQLSDEKETALHYAARTGHHDCLRLLIERSPLALEERTMWSYTPLLLSTLSGHSECSEMLMTLGADVHACDRSGQSVLHHAAIKDMPECMALLIERGAHPDIKNYEGNTPLILALKGQCVDSVSVLIQNGCDLNVMGRCTIQRRFSWYPALHIAFHSGNFDLVQMMVMAGCHIEPLRSLLVSEPESLVVLEQNSSILDWLFEICQSSPQSLLDCCKASIRRYLGRNIPHKAYLLPLPSDMKDYLVSIDLDNRDTYSKD